jgi:putative hydrolase of the HAD superfamily
VNASNPDHNAWALIERQEVDADTFDRLFAEESAALGHRIPGADVLAMLSGAVRPEMVMALDRVIAAGYVTACLTNNVRDPNPRSARSDVDSVMASFDHIIESSEVGCRKPEPRFYELACERASVTPRECVFLDDLGINLKPARAMGMATIKVLDPMQAIRDLEALLDLQLH